jgi:hypothetical protein
MPAKITFAKKTIFKKNHPSMGDKNCFFSTIKAAFKQQNICITKGNNSPSIALRTFNPLCKFL